MENWTNVYLLLVAFDERGDVFSPLNVKVRAGREFVPRKFDEKPRRFHAFETVFIRLRGEVKVVLVRLGLVVTPDESFSGGVDVFTHLSDVVEAFVLEAVEDG